MPRSTPTFLSEFPATREGGSVTLAKYPGVVVAGEQIPVSAAASIIYELKDLPAGLNFMLFTVDTNSAFYQVVGKSSVSGAYKTAATLDGLDSAATFGLSGWQYISGLSGDCFIEVPIATGGYYARGQWINYLFDGATPVGVNVSGTTAANLNVSTGS
ncbi:MAG: hypothetical protein LBS99_05350, partial [Clostridiales bacterium]|nr:hypothetical protein [Clostridiales bacterium]